ncbi:sporulation-control protein [Oikeobacillus pervagus]|uniref:Sporulation-control protein n=2 Tax=Oikeobacillus pervagus TaxID=1325931 RepID=A0AAJ1SXK4_9BACI|nr:sporulation-control protein [Oikeobacillus pervagus]
MMSFFNKVLASVGIGSAKVDTKLEKSSFIAGEYMNGVVEINGGQIEQKIDAIYITILTTYIRESNDKKYTDHAAIQKVQISDPFTIQANEIKTIPFSLQLPLDTPITYGRSRVWLATGLDIKNAVDPHDKDFIEVRPNSLTSAILEEIQKLGFRLREVECEQASNRIRRRYPFIQEFEFVPTSGPFRGKLDELEVMFLEQSEQSTEILLQVDRRARGIGSFLAEALEMDESFVRLSVAIEDLPQLRSILQQTISKHC